MQGQDLEIRIRSQHHPLAEADREKMEEGLVSFRKLVESFPTKYLHIDVNRHLSAGDFHVKASLELPGRTLFTGERDVTVTAAFERCIHKLRESVKGYKSRMRGEPERRKIAAGTRHEIEVGTLEEPDLVRLENAARREEWEEFRDAIRVYGESLHKRCGAVVSANPEAQARLDRDFVLTELVEAVYRRAFASFSARPRGRLGAWLESQIEPALAELLELH
jgi:ribosome-associated translation inhibitor RaiA